MQTHNRFFDDLARMANGALNTLTNLREEVETRVRERVERLLAEMDLVTREEFEAAKAMAQKARSEQEALGARLAALEQELQQLKGAKAASTPSTARRRTTKAKPVETPSE
jgi:BMFP domain-containing protein YqiC